MEFLNRKIEEIKGSEIENSQIMRKFFEHQSFGLDKIYEELNNNFSINKILEENDYLKNSFHQIIEKSKKVI